MGQIKVLSMRVCFGECGLLSGGSGYCCDFLFVPFRSCWVCEETLKNVVFKGVEVFRGFEGLFWFLGHVEEVWACLGACRGSWPSVWW